MASNDHGQKIKSLSVDESNENKFFHNESLAFSGTSKHQLLELDEKIQNAEINHESVKLEWDLLKPYHRDNIYNQSESILSERSISSFSNYKVMLSDHSSARREQTENNNFCNESEEKNLMNNACTDNHVQIVLTPRLQLKEAQTGNEIIPKLQIQVEDSIDNINLNTQLKKVIKTKKKLNATKVVNEPLKMSLIQTGKKKRKKFHGRLKTSNSKSTIATRDINISDKKNDRRKFKKQRSFDTISTFQASQYRKRIGNLKTRESNTSNQKEVVEIYQNAALKSGNISVVSSRQSKTRPTQVPHEELPGLICNHEQKKDFSVNEKSMENFLQPEPEQKENKVIKNIEPAHVNEETYQPGFCDSLSQRNYEMPTMASKMKRVDRPYYHRFNIRHIPFVVGTSISPSHNLGLNIQQVLSIIKTKQPTIPGISPLLIRNVSKGISPVSSLFEHIHHEFAKSCRTLNYQDINRSQKNNLGINQGISSFSCEHLRSNNLDLSVGQTTFKQPFACEPLYEEDEECHSVYSETHARNHVGQRKSFTFVENRLESTVSKTQQQTHYSFEKQSKGQGQQPPKTIFEDIAAGSNINHRSDKETAQVFARLHEQFNKMIIEHDKLKLQLEQRNDKALIKEVSELEEEINAKQQEITTVVSLYKEVMSLKKQMKIYHERNSFVCIATEDPSYNQISKSIKTQQRAQTAGLIDYSLQEKLFSNRRSLSMHDAPNGLRLTGLLRQIQAFQRQLVMA